MSPIKRISTTELLDMITEGVILIDKNARIAFSNNSFAELIDIDKETLIGMPFLEFVSRDDKRKIDGFVNDLIQSDAFVKDRTEFSLIDRTGTEYLVEMKVRKIPYEDKTGILASLADITERRKTRNELKKLLDLIPEVVLTTCPEDNTRIMKLFGFTDLEKALASNINDHYVDLKQRTHVIHEIKIHDEITDYPIKIKTSSEGMYYFETS